MKAESGGVAARAFAQAHAQQLRPENGGDHGLTGAVRALMMAESKSGLRRFADEMRVLLAIVIIQAEGLVEFAVFHDQCDGLQWSSSHPRPLRAALLR